MRVLALDYGRARCGCAVSDPSGTIVTPIEPVLRAGTRRGIGALAALCEELSVTQLIVGLPLSMRGQETAQTQETREFAARLARRVAIPVEFHDERLTTRLAQRDIDTQASEDSRAAAHLLEDWLAVGSRGGAGKQALRREL